MTGFHDETLPELLKSRTLANLVQSVLSPLPLPLCWLLRVCKLLAGAVAPPLLFGIFGAGTMWIYWLLKERTDGRTAYVEWHSGDDEDEAVKENVKRIKEKQDIEFYQREQGLLVRSWDLAQEESYFVAILVFLFEFTWWLIYKEVFCFLLRLFIGIPLVCFDLRPADIDENIIRPLEAQRHKAIRRGGKRADDDV